MEGRRGLGSRRTMTDPSTGVERMKLANEANRRLKALKNEIADRIVDPKDDFNDMTQVAGMLEQKANEIREDEEAWNEAQPDEPHPSDTTDSLCPWCGNQKLKQGAELRYCPDCPFDAKMPGDLSEAPPYKIHAFASHMESKWKEEQE